MAAAVAAKTAADTTAAADAAAADAARDGLRDRVGAWKAGKDGNLRALLATLHTVLWEGAPWTAPSMSDLIDPARVKRAYMKAALVVHPDKVRQRGGGPEQVAAADAAFDVLKGAWAKFEAGEMRRG